MQVSSFFIVVLVYCLGCIPAKTYLLLIIMVAFNKAGIVFVRILRCKIWIQVFVKTVKFAAKTVGKPVCAIRMAGNAFRRGKVNGDYIVS